MPSKTIGRPSRGLSEQRAKHTFVLHLDRTEQAELSDELDKMKLTGEFQDFMRQAALEAYQKRKGQQPKVIMPIPATPRAPTRPNGAHDEVYNEKVQEEA